MNRFIYMLVLLTTSLYSLRASDFQYSVPVSSAEGRRAYLWIPPSCQRVRGIIFCLNNMLEERFVVDPTIRKAAADVGLGIVWLQPGSDKISPVNIFLNNGNASAAIQQVLTDLAKESGYSEIEFAPLLVEEHSAASPFVYGIQNQMPNRIFAAIPLKGWFPGWKALGIPNLQIASSWAEHGEGWKKEFGWKGDIEQVRKYRAQDENCLMGEFVDISSGHFNFTPQSAVVIAMFIRKAVKLRIPENAPIDKPVELKFIDPNSGWLILPDKLGTPECKPVSCSQWQGDPKLGLWYFDEEMALTINNYMVDQLNKKPQMIQPVVNGQPVVLDKKGMIDYSPVMEPNGTTFKMIATWYDQAPYPSLYGGAMLGHVPDQISFRVGSGALDQVGPDLFKVGIHRGIVLNQGNPWEPHIIAYSNGNDEFRRADRPIHIVIDIQNKSGEQQTLDFPKIPDQKVKRLKALKLKAKASSGLPVQYFIISGPAVIESNVLKFDSIPPRSRFPLRVLVGAYQWGRNTDPKIKSVGPLIQEFLITK